MPAYFRFRGIEILGGSICPFRTLILATISVALLGLTFDRTEVRAHDSNLEKIEELRSEYRRPRFIKFPQNAPYSPQIAALGKMLFFDPRLSGAQNMSCATCHNPSFGWETPVAKAIGALNVPLGRHAPTVLNLADAEHFFWDGRADSLETQAVGPITHPKEMAADFEDLVKRLSEIQGYKHWFDKLFPGESISKRTIVTSIATYERTIQSGWAPFDRWVEGDDQAITEPAKRGFVLFNGKSGCSNCHTGWSFTDHQLHDIGLDTTDVGRAAIETGNPSAMHAFKTSGLRNIAIRAPYMHNGSILDLSGVIAHYASGGIDRPSISPLISKHGLSTAEQKDLLAFLETLTEENPHVEAPALPSR